MRHNRAQPYWAAGWGAILACLLVVLAAALASSATAATGDSTGGTGQLLARTATATPQANILFQDDFATYSGRWKLDDSPKASISVLDSALNMRIVSPGVSAWSLPDFDVPLADYRIEVLAEFRDGSADSSFGLVLDHRNDRDFYALVVTPKGEWKLLQRDGADWVDHTPTHASAVARESTESAMQLRADVTGESVAFYVDDHLVGEVTLDITLTEGGFGLIALAGKGYVDVSFDDMLVTARGGVDRP
jgi:hypothetical protein